MSDKIGGANNDDLYLAQGTSLLLFSKFSGFSILLGAAGNLGYGAILLFILLQWLPSMELRILV